MCWEARRRGGFTSGVHVLHPPTTTALRHSEEHLRAAVGLLGGVGEVLVCVASGMGVREGGGVEGAEGKLKRRRSDHKPAIVLASEASHSRGRRCERQYQAGGARECPGEAAQGMQLLFEAVLKEYRRV